MGLKGKLIAEYEVSSNGHQVHELLAMKPDEISKISPSHVQGCQLDEGEFGKPGSIITWNYTLDGKACFSKQVVEKVDEENKTVRYKVIEGMPLKEYSTFAVHQQATDKEVKLVFEYEKLHEDVPHPTKMLEFILNVNKDIDDHHLKP